MTIQIIDNFLPENTFLEVKNLLDSSYFPWYKFDVLNDYEIICDPIYNTQFIHVFYQRNVPVGEHTQILNPFLKLLNVRSLVKVKANLNPRTDKIIKHGFHTDFDGDDLKTAVYYVNTNDGYTLFKNGTKVESIQNRIVIFNVDNAHTGTTCTNSQYRTVINFNYF
jgi:hypothetical protein